jgi:GNAT superfamily N-acetyltransferase
MQLLDLTPTSRVRPMALSSHAEVELVATRMRETLVEVLGQERGVALYTMEWLRERVLFHLDPAKSTATVLLSENQAGHVTGHTIVRIEEEAGRKIGLFSTIFVEPDARRAGVAASLLMCGEAWMVQQRVAEATTYTSDANVKLINLFQKHGYRVTGAESEMVRLARPLALGA